MPSTKSYSGTAIPRGIDPDIAVVLQKHETRLQELGAGSGPTEALAVAGGQVSVGTGPAPIPGAVLMASTKRDAKWGMVPTVTWKWERVTVTATGTTMVFQCPSGMEWLPSFFLFRTRNSDYDASVTLPTISFGIVGGGYADVLAATAIPMTVGGLSYTCLPKSPAYNVWGQTQLYANISVAAAPGPAILDVYGVGILVPK